MGGYLRDIVVVLLQLHYYYRVEYVQYMRTNSRDKFTLMNALVMYSVKNRTYLYFARTGRIAYVCNKLN